MLLRIFLSFLFFATFSTLTIAQVDPAKVIEFNELPVQFLQVEKNYPLLNPAYVAVDSGINMVSGNKMNFGAFKIFRTNYFSVAVRIPASKDSLSKNHHGFGLGAVTDKNGEFINHNRVYFSYAYKISLAENLNWSTGMSIGLVNHSVEGGAISPSGSAFAPDGNVGTWIFSRKSYLGLSYNQIFRAKLTPLSETSVLVNHINVTAGKKFELSPYLQLTSSFIVRATKHYPLDVDIVNLFLINNKLSAGTNYKHHKGLVWMAGLENIVFGQGRHMAGGWFSYSIPFGKYVSKNIQPYEITLIYKIR
jgi:type IX secretion system PorP/SprF family membrane protein